MNECDEASTRPCPPVKPLVVAVAGEPKKPLPVEPPADTVLVELPLAIDRPKLPDTPPVGERLRLNVPAAAGPAFGATAKLVDRLMPLGSTPRLMPRARLMLPLWALVLVNPMPPPL